MSVGDAFVVAWGWDLVSNYLAQQRTDTMLDLASSTSSGSGGGDEYTLKPVQNVAYASAFEFHTQAQKETLMAALAAPDSGNFFWFGHGSTDSISGDGKVARNHSG